MRILWVKLGALWPLNTGGRIRTFNILQELSRQHRVTLLTTHAPDEDAGESARRLSFCEEVVSLPLAVPKHGSPAFLGGLVASWLSPLPVDVHKWRRRALRRKVEVAFEPFYETQTTACAPQFQDALSDAITALGHKPLRLPSGAGHDAQVMAKLCPAAMLFVRCRGGISHNPAEFASEEMLDV